MSLAGVDHLETPVTIRDKPSICQGVYWACSLLKRLDAARGSRPPPLMDSRARGVHGKADPLLAAFDGQPERLIKDRLRKGFAHGLAGEH